eukprot:Sdes_comp10145_c0_seq1m1758
MEQLEGYIRSANYKSLIQICEELELDERLFPKCQLTPQLYAYLLAGYLIEGQLENGRFLWKRIPANLKNTAYLESIWCLGEQLWKKDYENFHKQVKTLSWPLFLEPVIEFLTSRIRTNTIELISRAYSDIYVENAANLLGLSQTQCIELACHHSWKYDKENALLFPSFEEKKTFVSTNYDFVKDISQYILHMER